MPSRLGPPAAIAALALASVVLVGFAPTARPAVHERGAARTTLGVKHATLDADLASVASAYRRAGARHALRLARTRGAELAGSRLRVEVVARRNRAAVVLRLARAAGARVEARHGTSLQLVASPSLLARLATSPAVQHVNEVARAQWEAVPGQGVGSTGASTWHAAGVTGAGVRVAVIDAGFKGYRDRLSQGDLPAQPVTVDYCGSGAFEGPSAEDHGTAVAEIVHEMAPGAQLYLICADTTTQLAQAKDYVKANGIPIVNFSATYFATNRGDGSGDPSSPNGIVADARANNVLWVNSAGNGAQKHWSGTLADADADGWHEFAPGDEGNDLGALLEPGEEICAGLTWDEWPVTDLDYDFFLYDDATDARLAAGEDLQTGSQPPREALCYENTTGVALDASIAIRRYSGTRAPRLDLHVSNNTPDLQYRTVAGSVRVPASSPSAFAVGAVCWANGALGTYSSQGPTVDGRTKPDVAAPAGVSSGTFGATASCAGGFAGTSAAAPHVAGAAALVKQAFPGYSAAELQSFLEQRAQEAGSPGKDNQFGAGVLLLGLPPSSVPPPPPPPPPPSPGADLAVTVAGSPASIVVGQTYRFDVTVRNVGAASARNVVLTGAFSNVGGISWGAGSACSGPGSSFTCALGTLAGGGEWSFFASFTAGSAGSRTATVSVRSSPADASSANNSASASVSVASPSPPPPPADVAAPRVRALASSGRRGTTVRLLFRVSDNSGRASIRLRVFRGPRQIGSVAGRGTADAKVHFLRWRAPKRQGTLRFCASASDASGNTSARSCAPLRVR